LSREKNLQRLLGCRSCMPGQLNSPERLRLLDKSGLLEGEHPRLDRLTALASKLMDVPLVLVSLVDIDRQVFAGQSGLPAPYDKLRETPISHSFCQQVVVRGRPLIVDDAPGDERVNQNPAIKALGVLAYAGFPIVSKAQVLGSFCAIRTHTHHWEEAELEALSEFAEVVSDQVDLRLDLEQLKLTEQNLQRANEELENMAAVLAHDLKAPVRGIRGLTHFLPDLLPEVSDEALEILNELGASAGRMAELIESLGDFSTSLQIMDGAKWLELDALVDEVLSDLSQDIKSADASVTVVGKLGRVYGVGPLLRQLFQNLVGNAIKFQPMGQKPEVMIGRDEKKDAFYVKDNGIGLKHNERERIFSLYRRGESGQGYAGSGLGLAICSRVTSKHNGTIWVESTPGSGSTFYFTLGEPIGDTMFRERGLDEGDD